MGKPLLTLKDIKKLPYAATSFGVIRERENVYVDKTAMIARLAETEDAPVFLTRPRGFGKSLLVSAFESLFSRGLHDFKGLDIDTGEEKWTDKTYKVIHLDFSLFADDSCADLIKGLSQELAENFADMKITPLDEQGNYHDPADIIDQVCLQIADHSLVLLIDEYDSPVTHHLGDKTELDELSTVFANFFSAIKTWSGKFRFIFITGTAKVGEVTLFSSGFNNHKDISSDDGYAALLGITDEELRRYFDPYVRNAAAVLDISVSEVYDRMKSQYGGFQFSIGTKTAVYNPSSVISFLAEPERGFLNYWHSFGWGVPEIPIKYLENPDFRDLFNKLNCRIKEEILPDCLVDENMLLEKSEPGQVSLEMLLYQTGYFTLRQESRSYARLAIPNDEVSESLIKLSLDINHSNPSSAARVRLAKAGVLADSGDIAGIMDLFNGVLFPETVSHAGGVYDENTVRDFIYALLPRRGFLKSRLTGNAGGFSGIEIKTGSARLVIAFKMIRNEHWQESARKTAMIEALDQLRTHDYDVTAEDMKLIQVGMVISPAQKKIVEYRILNDRA